MHSVCTDGAGRIHSAAENGDQCGRGREKNWEKYSEHARDIHSVPQKLGERVGPRLKMKQHMQSIALLPN